MLSVFRSLSWPARVAVVLLITSTLLSLFMVVANAQAANTATITFQGSTQFTDGTPYPTGAVVTYNLWQGLKGATRTKVGAFVSGGSITTGLLTGNEYCWDVTTVVKLTPTSTTFLESAHSNAACKDFAGVPGTVTITVN